MWPLALRAFLYINEDKIMSVLLEDNAAAKRELEFLRKKLESSSGALLIRNRGNMAATAYDLEVTPCTLRRNMRNSPKNVSAYIVVDGEVYAHKATLSTKK